MSAEFPDLLTTAEVAQRLRQPDSTLRYWRHIGTGPASIRIGRRVLYDAQVVSEWLKQQQLVQAS